MKNKNAWGLVVGLLTILNAFGQSRLILNGGIVTISNNAYLVVDNPSANAIVRNDGHLVSEGENNKVKWTAGSTTGTYSVPFGYNGSYLPVAFTKSSGTGNGALVFSTYHTGWKNSDFMPTGITNMAGESADQSAFVLDRFWQVNAEGYSVKPSLTDLSFTYIDPEHQVPSNTITEANLRAEQWNPTTSNWDPPQPGGTINTSTNTITVASVSANSFYTWWSAAEQLSPLPLSLLSFTATAIDKNALLSWVTASEDAGTRFILQRSKGGVVFEEVATIISIIYGSNTYNHTDTRAYAGISYYRIKIVEPTGKSIFSPIKKVSINESLAEITIYPNPILNKKCIIQFNKTAQKNIQLTVMDLKGTIVTTITIPAGLFQFNLQLPKHLSAGVYVCDFRLDDGHIQKQITVY